MRRDIKIRQIIIVHTTYKIAKKLSAYAIFAC